VETRNKIAREERCVTRKTCQPFCVIARPFQTGNYPGEGPRALLEIVDEEREAVRITLRVTYSILLRDVDGQRRYLRQGDFDHRIEEHPIAERQQWLATTDARPTATGNDDSGNSCQVRAPKVFLFRRCRDRETMGPASASPSLREGPLGRNDSQWIGNGPLQ